MSASLLERRARVVPRGVGRQSPLVVSHGEGPYLITPEGRRVLDLATGIAVLNLGHGHPAVLAAAHAQLDRLAHTCFHVATYEPYVALCERLVERLPHGTETRALLVNSGAEAVENAVKIARQATGRPALIVFTEAFHGRTLLCATLTSRTALKSGTGPFAPEVYRLPFPHRLKRGDGLDEAAFVKRELDRLREAFSTLVRAEDVAAVVVEVVQGEGGFVPAPLEWLRGLRALTREHGILLVVDEIQTGFCRTGRFAAYEHAGITPDLSTYAKALGGGLPLAAVVGRADVMDAALPGTLGGTFAGNPVACAAALAVLDQVDALQLARRARELGERIQPRLAVLAERFPWVAEARGLGAMQAIELVDEGGQAAPDLARRVVEACLERDVLVLTAGVHGNVIRLLPPLTLEHELLERALEVLARAVEQCTPGTGASPH